MIVILTPQTSTEPLPTAQVVAKAAAEYGKPVVASYMGGPRVIEGFRYLMEHRVPAYPFPERAVAAMDALYRHRLWMDTPPSEVSTFSVAKDKVAAVFQQSRAAGRLELGEQEAREVIGAYGFKMPRSVLATTHEEAVAAAREVGMPVVMKISSPDILHKSDVGGVRVGVATELEVVGAFTAIIESARRKLPEADISGVLVQEMIRGGRETILGMTRDAQFGPMIMFGLGGIYVEVLKDVLIPHCAADPPRRGRDGRRDPLRQAAPGRPRPAAGRLRGAHRGPAAALAARDRFSRNRRNGPEPAGRLPEGRRNGGDGRSAGIEGLKKVSYPLRADS